MRLASFWGIWPCVVILGCATPQAPVTLQADSSSFFEVGWKAGVARRDITPTEPVWLAGYAHRNHPADGTLHPLWVKALALEDRQGQTVVLVTSDLLGFPKGMSDRIRTRIEETYQLPRSRVILNSSHTHSGPVLKASLDPIYPLDAEANARIERYSLALETQVVEGVGEALGHREACRVFSGTGLCRFAVNRRNNREAELTETTSLNGPIDHAVPVLKVTRKDGSPLALVFGYACHATVLDTYVWCGDYPGFAQIELETQYPGTTAMFFAGCGADINPLPRRSVGLARQYGKELAVSVQRILEDPMRPLSPVLKTAYSEVSLVLADANPTEYPYPVVLWHLGEQPIVALGGEVVVDYAIALKGLLGRDLMVMGFSNDLMSYIPSVRVLKEGGYEGATSQKEYGMPAVWREDIETRILEAVKDLSSRPE